MNPLHLRERLHAVRSTLLVFVVLGLGCVGCTSKIYVGPELPEVSPRDVRIPETRTPLNLEISCSFGDELGEERCGLFSSVVEEVFRQYASILPAENIDRLAVKFRDPKGRDRLIMEAEFTPISRPSLRREYKGSLHFGLGVPTGARPVLEYGVFVSELDLRAAEKHLVNDMALNLVRDLQQGGEL
jgi:hypothetical protein